MIFFPEIKTPVSSFHFCESAAGQLISIESGPVIQAVNLPSRNIYPLISMLWFWPKTLGCKSIQIFWLKIGSLNKIFKKKHKMHEKRCVKLRKEKKRKKKNNYSSLIFCGRKQSVSSKFIGIDQCCKEEAVWTDWLNEQVCRLSVYLLACVSILCVHRLLLRPKHVNRDFQTF